MFKKVDSFKCGLWLFTFKARSFCDNNLLSKYNIQIVDFHGLKHWGQSHLLSLLSTLPAPVFFDLLTFLCGDLAYKW